MKFVNEDIEDILKPKDSKSIIEELIEKGSIEDKYAVVVQLFSEDYDMIFDEFFDRGIDKEDLIDAYISFWGDFRRISKPEKIHWILSDILQDHIDEISNEIIKKALL